MNKKFYTRTEAAEVLGVHPQSVSNYAAKGVLHEIRYGNYIKYPAEEVDALRNIPEFYKNEEIEAAVRKMREEMEEMQAQLATGYKEMREEFKRVFTDGHTQTWFRYRELVWSIFNLAADETITYRDKEIVRDVLDLDTLQDIADRYDLTRERVRQIFERSLRRVLRFRDIATSRLETANGAIEELKKKNSKLEATVWALAHPETGKPAEEVVSELEQYRRLPPFNIKLKDYGISVRAYNCCKAADIETIGDLCSKTRLQLMKLRNFGRKSFNELDGLLEKMNLGWGMWTDPDYDYRLMRRKKKDA